jgi:ankyrin repeat protein
MTGSPKLTFLLLGIMAASVTAVFFWSAKNKAHLARAQEEKGDNFVRTAALYGLHNALERQDVKAFAEMIDGMKDPKINKSEIMQNAAFMGTVPLVKTLLDRGWDPNGFAKDGSPLSNSALVGHTDVAKLFLQRGARVDACGQDGRTPLACAAQGGSVDTVLLLLSNGASVNTQISMGCICDPGYTPLMFAVRNEHPEIVKILLGRHADVNRVSAKGDTALSLARHHHMGKIVQMLEAAGAKK